MKKLFSIILSSLFEFLYLKGSIFMLKHTQGLIQYEYYALLI